MASLRWRIVNYITRTWLLKSNIYYKHLIHALRKQGTTKRIWLFGIPTSSNLGDQAQTMCTLRWFGTYDPVCAVCCYSTRELSAVNWRLLNRLREFVKPDEMIFFQSGYNLTDRYPQQEEMHRAVVRAFPENRFVFLPQTLSFQKPLNTNEFVRTSEHTYAGKRILLLCRDKKSLDLAQRAFPDIPALAFPDIVTTLIGERECTNQRDGILLCLREDLEKAMTDDERETLVKGVRKIGKTKQMDTTLEWPNAYFISKKREKYICKMIGEFAKVRAVITDRYHGLIFSLCAGTPVVLLKTTDHKITEGLHWFGGELRDMIAFADTAEQAIELVRKQSRRAGVFMPRNSFNALYYDRLKGIIEAELEMKNEK